MKKVINFFIGLLIIFLILFFSDFILKLTKITFPAPILGIILLFLLLKFKILKENLIEDFCNFSLRYMILFFIPMFVGTMNYFEIISKNFLAIIFTIFFTTTLVIVFTGLFTYNVIKYQRLHSMKKRGVK